MLTIRCAAFGLAKRACGSQNSALGGHLSTLDSHLSTLEIDCEVASTLIDGPLGDFFEGISRHGSPVHNRLVRGRPVHNGLAHNSPVYSSPRSDNSEGAESLCKLYELILNLVPIDLGAGKIEVREADKARKRRGSFYTPKALSKLTVEVALEPLLKEPMRPGGSGLVSRSRDELPASAELSNILQLRILDPAMGAGIFVLAAYEYLLRMATDCFEEREGSSANISLSADQGSPLSADEVSRCLTQKTSSVNHVARNADDLARLIAQNCIYGVDIDEVAVETATLALWLAVGDFKLSPRTAFPNLRVGNSLVGTRTESIGEFPSAVWKRKDLIDAKIASSASNRAEPVDSEASRGENLDRWCAFWFMSREELLAHHASGVSNEIVRSYRNRVKFFHWNEEFPEVFTSENPGFDAVIGNPPWEIEKPNSREFFGSFKKEYWNLGKQDAIKTQVELKERFPQLEAEWLRLYRDHYAMANWVKYAPVQFGSQTTTEERSFQYQGRGDSNLYKLFVEQAYRLTRSGGAVALIVPSGIYSDCGTRELRQLLLNKCHLRRVIGFDNSDGAFDIHRSFKYCIFVATKSGETRQTSASFMNTADSCSEAKIGLRSAESGLNGGLDTLERDSIDRISPKWSVICEVENKLNLELVDKISSAGIRLGECEFNGEKLAYAREFDMTLDSRLFHAREKLEFGGAFQDVYGNWLAGKWRDVSLCGPTSIAENEELILSACGDRVISLEDVSNVFVPLYEGRMIGQFDFSEKQWAAGKGRQAVWRQTESKKTLGPQYLVELDVYKERRAASFKTAFLAVGSPTNARTMISTCLSEAACGNSVPVFHVPESAYESDVHTLSTVEFHLILTSILNSFVFDFALRRRMSGNNLNYFVLEECTICDITNVNDRDLVILKSIAKCAVLLAMDGYRYSNPLMALGYNFVPDPINRTSRTMLRASIDAMVATLYGLSMDEFRVILAGEGLSGTSRQKGFWRVDKNLPQAHSLIESAILSGERIFEIGATAFCAELELSIDGLFEENRCADAKVHSDLFSRIISRQA